MEGEGRPRMPGVKLSDAVGELCWKCDVGVGSFLTLEFGNPFIWERERCLPQTCDRYGTEHRCVDVIGGWTLWVYQCRWWITRYGEPAGDSNGDRLQLASYGASLVGGELCGIEWCSEWGSWFVNLEFGYRIRMSPYDHPHRDSTSPLAIMFGPTRSTISLMEGGRMEEEDSGLADLE